MHGSLLWARHSRARKGSNEAYTTAHSMFNGNGIFTFLLRLKKASDRMWRFRVPVDSKLVSSNFQTDILTFSPSVYISKYVRVCSSKAFQYVCSRTHWNLE